MIRTYLKIKSNKSISPEEFISRFQERMDDRKQRMNDAEAKAREYFFNKERIAYYSVDGYDYLDHDSPDRGFIYLTDEEVAHLKFMIVNDANQFLSENYKKLEEKPGVVNTVKDALKYCSLKELIEKDKELYDLLYDRCMDCGLYPADIDLDTRNYFYRFFM